MMDLNIKLNKQLLEKLIQRKDVVFIAAVLLVSLFLARGISGKLASQINTLQNQIERQKKVNVLAVSLSKLQARFNDYQKTLPEDINAFTALDRINELAKNSGIRLITVTPSEPRDKAVYLEFPLNIKLETDYMGIANFVKKLEDLKTFKVLNLDIAPLAKYEEAELGQSTALSVTISLLAVSLKK